MKKTLKLKRKVHTLERTTLCSRNKDKLKVTLTFNKLFFPNTVLLPLSLIHHHPAICCSSSSQGTISQTKLGLAHTFSEHPIKGRTVEFLYYVINSECVGFKGYTDIKPQSYTHICTLTLRQPVDEARSRQSKQEPASNPASNWAESALSGQEPRYKFQSQ